MIDMDIETEILLAKCQLVLLTRKVQKNLRSCRHLSESIERAFPSSEHTDHTLYRSEKSFLSMNVSHSKN